MASSAGAYAVILEDTNAVTGKFLVSAIVVTTTSGSAVDDVTLLAGSGSASTVFKITIPADSTQVIPLTRPLALENPKGANLDASTRMYLILG